MLRLFNSLSRKVEDFVPLNPPKVGMYTCGPTVYDYLHIGNLRTFIFSDILYRVLKLNGYEVKLVENITDIEDKIIKRAAEKNMTVDELTAEYTKIFFEDEDKLNILPADINPKATEHIHKMINFIEKLIAKGFAYVEKDNSVYFDISKFSDYGKLSQIDSSTLKTGTRILSDEYTKDNVQDFALWKSVPEVEFGYDSPWGKGRPGWHIECSVMSQEYLGDTLDIHTGGIDLLFPHHENEIAQSQSGNGVKFANYFIHGQHLLVDGQKMSKSLNNFYRVSDLEAKDFDPLAFRYLTLTAHYRDQMNFTWSSLESAQNALNNLRQMSHDWDESGQVSSEYLKKFTDSLNNDLNTAQAIAVMWEMVKSDALSADKAATLLEFDKVLGLNLGEHIGKKLEIPAEVEKLLEERQLARSHGDFKRSDELRSEIKKLGFEIEDSVTGQKIKQ